MKQKKEKTTVLFVSKNSKAPKPVQISSQLILNWKKYVAVLSLIFFSLVASIVYLCSSNLQQYKLQDALSRKIQSMHTLFSQVDTGAMRKKFTKIDKDLSTINGFLKARGIQTASKEPQGGEVENDVLSTDEITDFYDSYLNRIMYNISYTPLGAPYPGNITSNFGHRENPFGGSNVETHKGLDIKGPMGAPVKAMAKGEVSFAGLRGGFGNCIILKHGNGFETLYGHLSKILVSSGQQIEIGQQIGNIGSTGRSTGPHLHYEVHRNGQKINPQSFLTLN
ncbi:MAG TPA: M23 family metallopeptidase [Chitinophagaceae bacterium]|nr:M23 family metallopeptidase [Chitinophagaceae bacterium]